MALSDRKILEELKKGNILIEPFERQNLATSSYDVRLGEWYFREQKQNFDVYNPYDKSQTDKTEPSGIARTNRYRCCFRDYIY